jgi:nucleotide-binding universal stress UspA family protein
VHSLSKILLPTDFSARSAAAVHYAAQFAERFGSSLTLLHVIEPLQLRVGLEDAGEPLLQELFVQHRDEVVARLKGFCGDELDQFQVTRVVAEGDPAKEIIEYAHAGEYDLIMMPTRGCGMFRRFILGSVTAKVLHDARCPVWTSAHLDSEPAGRAAPISTVLYAMDPEADSTAALGWASGLAVQFAARLVVVHAIPSLEYHPEIHYLERDVRRVLMERATDKIRKVLATSPAPNADIHVGGGAVHNVIRCAAEQYLAALVIIGRSSPQGLLGRLRTNSYSTIRDSPCPVLSV